MITITIFKNKSGSYKGFQCMGHADFANKGKDIVCSAVSILVINTINAMETLLKEPFSYQQAEADGMIKVDFADTPSVGAALLLDAMVLGLEEVKKQYGTKYTILKYKEV